MAHTIQALAGHGIELIPLCEAHAADYQRFANHPDIGWRMNMPQPFKLANFDDLMQRIAKDKNHFVWMIYAQNAACGMINSGDMRDVGIFQGGYCVDPDFQGKGIATAALQLVRDFLIQQCKAVRVQAVVEPDNIISVHVLEKCGYAREGLLRKFYPSLSRGLIDVYMYAIVKGERADG